jgi:hypothetical protein
MAEKFKIGDAVTFINDYGVAFYGKTVIGIEYWHWSQHPDKPRYFYTPTDSPWFSVAEANLHFKSPGQIAYDKDVAERPLYHDGAPRAAWERLSEIARYSWEYQPDAARSQIQNELDACQK